MIIVLYCDYNPGETDKEFYNIFTVMSTQLINRTNGRCAKYKN